MLDDCRSGSADPRSRLYTGHVGTLSCARAAELPALLEQMQDALRQGRHAVGVFAYELGEELQDMPARPEGRALTQVLLFERCEHLTEAQTDAWLRAQDQTDAPAGVADIRASVDEAQFAAAIARIHAYLEAGDTYQVNYTYRLRFDAYGSPFALYRKLRASQVSNNGNGCPHGAQHRDHRSGYCGRVRGGGGGGL